MFDLTQSKEFDVTGYVSMPPEPGTKVGALLCASFFAKLLPRQKVNAQPYLTDSRVHPEQHHGPMQWRIDCCSFCQSQKIRSCCLAQYRLQIGNIFVDLAAESLADSARREPC